ncbi:3-carboxy-cis,cis-muconate cycloisomerase [Cryobacterium flavum]|uniref:3-carboxy-cis,cis-muconate cycloisomerase n=1 Tax=Cryobacterium flavum TaxID=1424659 RepID=A0A4R8V0T4_9MICO|nr:MULTISPECIES: lyase family protein [Cryobacterium]TFB74264.1 3-carboxy-cis,cis-muconate cycloisomerase [Cryobacterium flavum]SDO14418.1 3-carboxy-cis,cis-muconate cycloisomerase [Cryobacterium flavum]
MTNFTFDVGLLNPLSHGTRESELTSDQAWLQAMVDAELALTRALVDAELAPEWMLAVCDALADARQFDLRAIAAEARNGGNPVIPFVKHLGRAAERVRAGASDHLHVGATSQDILDTAAMIVARKVICELIHQLDSFGADLADLADEHRGTVMSGRTLGQQASPTSFGFVAAGWLDAVLLIVTRLEGIRDSLPVQLGGAVGNLSVLTEIGRARRSETPASEVLDTVLERFADHVGLVVPRLSWHTNRVVISELASVLAAATGVAGTFALDVSVLSRNEIAEVSERLAPGQGGSSAMPHKRNPVSAVLITAAALQTPGLASTLYGSMLAEDQRPSGAWHAEWQSLRVLERLTISAVTGAASLVARLDVDPDRMRANLDLTDGLVFSERVTTILAETVGKTTAFALVERASQEAFATNRPLQVVLASILITEGCSDELRAQIWAAFDYEGQPGQSAAGIDRVVRAFRQRSDAAARRARAANSTDMVEGDDAKVGAPARSNNARSNNARSNNDVRTA